MNIETITRKEIEIPVGGCSVKGILTIPDNAKGLIIFAHGSGSSRLSPRNNEVANDLNESGYATLLFDLLTEKEDLLRENRFNIKLLAERLIVTTGWIMGMEEITGLPIGYFGASTGSAAALLASTRLGHKVKAIVSRGGRPDLVMSNLEYVKKPVLLIVGARDEHVIHLNRNAYFRLPSNKKMRIVDGASHLFEEPGKLKVVTELAKEWYDKHLIGDDNNEI